MKNIKSYANKAAYDADLTRPTNQSLVNMIVDTNSIIRKGVNIITEGRYATEGDTVVWDTVDLRPKVVKYGTLALPLSSRYIICGTVKMRTEKNVFVVANQNVGSFKWAAPWKVKLSGFSFASAGSFTLTINSTQTAAINYATSDTLTTLAASIQAAIRAVMTVATWTVTAYSNYIVVEQNSYTPNVTGFTCSDVGITVNVLTGNYQTATSGLLNANTSVFRVDGSVTSWALTNLEKSYLYYSVSGLDTTGGQIIDAGIIKESRFNATDNPILFNAYGTYMNYLSAKKVRYPYSKGIITDLSGKSNTDKLAGVMFTDHDGTQKTGYDAAYAAKTFGITGAGIFDVGNWWLPSLPELYLIMKDVTEGLTGFALDKLNAGIDAAEGTKINAGHYMWSSSEYGGSSAFRFNGPLGYMGASGKLYAGTVRPVSAFQIL